MFDAQHSKRLESDRSQAAPAQEPSRTKQNIHHTGDLTRIPLYTQWAWGNLPPPWLRLQSPQQAPTEQPLQRQTENGLQEEGTPQHAHEPLPMPSLKMSPLQRTDAAQLPLYTQWAWGNQPPPWLRPDIPQQAPPEGEPLQRAAEPTQHNENTTGLPDTLKAGVEQLSGLSMDDVQVHYHSSKPAEVQALAYTQGTQIHAGTGQEQYLPHEAWHVVQQKQGRVQPTIPTKGAAINDDEQLEKEADEMGSKAERGVLPSAMQLSSNSSPAALTSVIQRKKLKKEAKNALQAALQKILAKKAITTEFKQLDVTEIIRQIFLEQNISDTSGEQFQEAYELLMEGLRKASESHQQQLPVLPAPNRITQMGRAEQKQIQHFRELVASGEGSKDFPALIDTLEEHHRFLVIFCTGTETIVPFGAQQGNEIWKLDLDDLKGLGAAILNRLDNFAIRKDSPQHKNMERKLPTYKEPGMEKDKEVREIDKNYYEYSLGGAQGLRIVVDAVHKRVYLSLHYGTFFVLYLKGVPLGGKILEDAIGRHMALEGKSWTPIWQTS